MFRLPTRNPHVAIFLGAYAGFVRSGGHAQITPEHRLPGKKPAGKPGRPVSMVR